MPRTSTQRIVFSILMAFAMVYGMELYNQALLAGCLRTELFAAPFADIVPLMAAVIVLETLVGGRVAARLVGRTLGSDPARRPEVLATILRGAFTCWTMCPNEPGRDARLQAACRGRARGHVAPDRRAQLPHGAALAALRGGPCCARRGARAGGGPPDGISPILAHGISPQGVREARSKPPSCRWPERDARFFSPDRALCSGSPRGPR